MFMVKRPKPTLLRALTWFKGTLRDECYDRTLLDSFISDGTTRRYSAMSRPQKLRFALQVLRRTSSFASVKTVG